MDEKGNQKSAALRSVCVISLRDIFEEGAEESDMFRRSESDAPGRVRFRSNTAG